MSEILGYAVAIGGAALLLVLLANGGTWLYMRSVKRRMDERDELKGRNEWLGPIDVIEAKKEEDAAVLGGKYADGLLEGLRRQERERKAKIPLA